MRRYQRFVRFASDELEPDTERLELATLLKTAPGFEDFAVIGAHPKGGFRVRLTLSPDALGAFILHVEQSNWRAAM